MKFDNSVAGIADLTEFVKKPPSVKKTIGKAKGKAKAEAKAATNNRNRTKMKHFLLNKEQFIIVSCFFSMRDM